MPSSPHPILPSVPLDGIVRIDIAVRPVRSIDYVYATIRVKN